jgi:hypothetical protein
MKTAFFVSSFDEFRRTDKRDYYAWLYGSYGGRLIAYDFFYAYCMGGEL